MLEPFFLNNYHENNMKMYRGQKNLHELDLNNKMDLKNEELLILTHH